VTVEPAEGAHFSDPPSTNLLNVGGVLFPDYVVDTFLFIRSEDAEVSSGTLQVRIQLAEGQYVYDTLEINVTHRLLPRETWTRMVRLDVREFATTTIKYTLMEDDDGDGTFTLEKDHWETSVRVYPGRGDASDNGGSAANGGVLPDRPWELDWRPGDGIL
jgi:hypothetical protein